MADPIIQPYLMFGGRCDEALAFYSKALGAQVDTVMRFRESPSPIPAGVLQPGFENKVMHSSFRIGGNTIMASDGCHEGQTHAGFSLCYSVKTIPEADSAFAALSDGGKVTMPLAKTFWSPRYGMLTDRFGIDWMVIVMAEPT